MADNVYGRELTTEEIAAGVHRDMVGGLWEDMGRLQLDFLQREGLTPESTLLDVGCGCLRAGVQFVRFLEPGRYYGIDANASLLKAGLEHELPRAGLAGRLPPDHLLVNDAFEGWRFGVTFDYALAQSVFTHLPAAQIAGALRELARCIRPGGRLCATFFECKGAQVPESVVHEPGGVTSFRDRDPFHYRFRDLAALCAGLPWNPVYLGGWGHPRDQRMIRFERTRE
jgi:SAM-dependent methyltransferase